MTKEELLNKTFGAISLGCDKNRVDLEKMIYRLSSYGLKYTDDLSAANIIIVNTCSFIQSAKKESVDSICGVLDYKKGACEKLIVTGCLAQRYYDEVKDGFPEVDAVVRIKNNDKIVDVVLGLYGVEDTSKYKVDLCGRVLSTPSNYAYLKISDGCNNCCSYCTIPHIRGRFTSVPASEIVEEAKMLVKRGVTELILVAQDVTNYGADIYGKPMLVDLIRELSKIKKLKWIRLHYCYPNLIDDELLNEIDNNKKVCKYLDIPMQHASDSILKSMNRKDTKEAYTEILDKIHHLKHFVAIRSTFIVGYPGETEKDFSELKEFLAEQKMQYVGFFEYSREEYTAAYRMPHQVSEKVKDKRLQEIEEFEQKIMADSQEKFIGTTNECVLEKIEDDGTLILRNQYNSPNIDSVVYSKVKGKGPFKIGNYYKVKITGLNGIDLEGEIL